MALKEFKDLPNTDTPINAENLNNNFNELKEVTEKSYMLATVNNNWLSYDGQQTIDPIALDTVVHKKGEKFTLENDKIRVGAGVSAIRVSAAIFINDFIGTGYAWGKIMKNGGAFATAILPTITGAAPYGSVCIPSTIVPVKEGDLINLRVEQTARDYTVIRGYESNTFLFVEEYY